MSDSLRSLQQIYPRSYFIPIALFFSAIFLTYGLFLPIITLKELIFWKTTFSVITGIQNLFLEGHFFLGAIILLFSVFFPILKITALLIIWYYPVSKQSRAMVVGWLGSLGKWSMLDVFVIALMIVITKISGFASAEARIGIYFFSTSILLAMVTTEKINVLLKKTEYPSTETQ